MAFLGGPECSTAANPLSQFTKHVQDDTSLQRDRLVGRRQDGLGDTFRSQPVGPQDAMFDDFMRTTSLPSTQSFAMDMLRRELDTVQYRTGSSSYQGHSLEPHVHGEEYSRSPGLSPADFKRFHQISQSSTPATARAVSPLNQQTTYLPSMGPATYSGYQGMNMSMGMNNYMPPTIFNAPALQTSDKGKARMVELDDKEWESQFAQMDDVQASDLNASETDHMGDFESIWNGVRAEAAANAQTMEEAGSTTHDSRQAHDDLDRWKDFDGLQDMPEQDAALGNYLFERNNPFKDTPDPFEQGKRIIAEGGNLSLAALAFETAVQRDPQHVGAWTALGQAQAQNEKETPAIRALEQALKIDPSNLDALMGLAVSYTNEGYENTAYRTLERWVMTRYPDLKNGQMSSDSSEMLGWVDRHRLQAKVTDLFIRAAQKSPSGEAMDPDVQVGLGVLFYGAEEYDKAVDCFGAALASSQQGTTNTSSQVPLLWNQLGATLANSGRSEEAIDAYEKALQLRPNFVRARYNLGVSCINMGCYEQAANHLLGALAMHRVLEDQTIEWARKAMDNPSAADHFEGAIRQNESTNLFDTLRRVFAQMDRRDLQDLVGPGMDLDEFRRQGFLAVQQ